MSNNADILKSLTIQEQQLYFKYVQRFNLINDKIDNGIRISKDDDEFLNGRPYEITKDIHIDLIERSIVLLDYRSN